MTEPCERAYIDAGFAAIDRRFNDIHRQIDVTARGLDKRLDAMNEFRATLTSQAATFVSRDVFETALAPLREFKANIEGRVWAIGGLLTLLNAAIAAAVYFGNK